ncbi:MAG TPA: hypothetical protein VNE62_00170, partial [Actinomycetota bacterium]|nr:hypothetical protein [Actinomycetota bacterium]
MTRKALVSSSEQYSAEAQGEVCRRLPGASVGQALAPGLHLWDLATPFVDAASKLLRDRPVFVRHVAPVHRVVVLANRQDDDLQLIRTQVRDHLLGHFQPGLPFSVQHRVLPMLAYRPYEIQVALQDEVQ